MSSIASRFAVAAMVVVAVASAVYLVRQWIDARQAPAIVITDAAAERPVTVAIDGAVATPGTYTLAPGARVQDALAAAGGTLPAADDSVNPARLLQDGERLIVPTRAVTTMTAPSAVTAPAGSPDASSSSGATAPAAPTASATHGAMTSVTATEDFVRPANGDVPLSATRGTSPQSAEPTAPAIGSAAAININTASAADLDALPGIGPVLSERIVAYREEHGPFAAVDDLAAVDGISSATVERLRPLVTV